MRVTIRLKLIAALLAGLALIAAVTAVLLRFVHERAIEVAAGAEVEEAARLLEQYQARDAERLAAVLDALSADDRYVAAFEARDRAALLAAAEPVFASLRGRGITHWYFHDPDPPRGVFLRVHRPELHGDSFPRKLVVRAAATGSETRGSELGRTAYALRVVRPWLRAGRTIGYLELGEDVHTVLARMKESTGDDYGLLLVKERLDRQAWSWALGAGPRWDARPDLLAVQTTTGDEAVLDGLGRLSDVPDAPMLLGRRQAGGRTLVRGLFPLREGGEKIGAVVVLHDVTALSAGAGEVRGRVLVVVAMLAAGLAALLVFLLEVLVFERLARISRALEDLPQRLARGDWAMDVAPSSDDEIGRFEAFFRRAIEEIGSFVSDARRDRSGSRRS
ncbi:MAG TPA: cache domain-containing protein [Anaeromyxobacteraceae bacterium]|nr:cache domain-containing protein [Anaeromyxobacteraceae bacterium]